MAEDELQIRVGVEHASRARAARPASRSRPCSPRRRAAGSDSRRRIPCNRRRSPRASASRDADRSAHRASRRARRSARSACRRARRRSPSPCSMAPLKPSVVTVALKLVGRRGRIDWSAAPRRPANRVGIGLDDGGEPVVDAPRRIRPRVAAELLRRRRSVREHLDVDAGLVHRLEAPLADILEARHHRRWRAGVAARKGRDQLVVGVVLLQRDDRAIRLLQHVRTNLPEYWRCFLAIVACDVTRPGPC